VLETVNLARQSINAYKTSSGLEAVAELRDLAAPLQGLRVLHLNATRYGGGVAEILQSEIPLLRDLGLAADWQVIDGDEAFFSVTKKIHNCLQGARGRLTPAERDVYLAAAEENARRLDEQFDIVVIHDPQPLALCHLTHSVAARWIWRCHIDTCAPNPQVWKFLRPYLADFDAAIFTREEFVPHDVPIERIEIIPPAIDPLNPKNMRLTQAQASRILGWIGLDQTRPLMVQVSRFDPWKDPLGVIQSYRLVKREVPNLQLALVGSMALDDPEGWEVYRSILPEAERDPDIHILTNLMGVSNVEVNALQRLADVGIQKSVREGFGLVVSETLWKGTPMVATRVGGIPLQLENRVGGFLVDSVEECADRTLWLLQHPRQSTAFAARGRERVRERFLLTRLIADELRLYGALLESSSGSYQQDFESSTDVGQETTDLSVSAA
jgi:trehalose synthase